MPRNTLSHFRSEGCILARMCHRSQFGDESAVSLSLALSLCVCLTLSSLLRPTVHRISARASCAPSRSSHCLKSTTIPTSRTPVNGALKIRIPKQLQDRGYQGITAMIDADSSQGDFSFGSRACISVLQHAHHGSSPVVFSV